MTLGSTTINNQISHYWDEFWIDKNLWNGARDIVYSFQEKIFPKRVQNFKKLNSFVHLEQMFGRLTFAPVDMHK